MRSTAEVLVIGGGPAGLVAAIECRIRGLDVTLVERQSRSSDGLDKPCGEGLMPDGVARLQALGVDLDGAGRAFAGIRYIDPSAGVGGRPVVVDGRFPAGHGVGVRRTRLHRRLVEHATEIGVDLRWATQVVGIEPAAASVDVHLVDDQVIGADWLIGADGLRSKVRAWAGLDGRPARWRRFGVRRHLALTPWSDRVEVHWSDLGEAYVTPVGELEVGVALLWSGHQAGFDELIRHFPQLAERLDGAERLSRDRGIGPLRQRVRDVVRGRSALVGDASGYVDAITGEGLTLAFHQAAALAAALADGDLGRYRREHRAIGRVPWGLTEMLLGIERWPRLRRRVLRALEREPAIFERFLAVHCRAASPWTLAPAAPRMLWRLATS